jgi:hypothetical protein
MNIKVVHQTNWMERQDGSSAMTRSANVADLQSLFLLPAVAFSRSPIRPAFKGSEPGFAPRTVMAPRKGERERYGIIFKMRS